MIRAAIVGMGRWGKNMLDAVQGKSDKIKFIRGVVRHPDSVRELAEKHGITVSSDFDAVLRDPEVDVIVLATPHSVHKAHILAAAAARKPVHCEKPLALTKADAQIVVEACRRAGVLLGVGQDKRFWPSMRELKQVVAGGQLGQILHIEGNLSNDISRRVYSAWRDAPAESPGASMTATGIHVLDAFVNLIGPVKSVYARATSHQSPRPDPIDTISVLLDFENGVTGILSSVRPTPFSFRLQVYGTEGSAEAVGENDVVIRMVGSNPRHSSLEPVNALRAELEAFADGVTNQSTYPIPVSQMIGTIACLEAISISMQSNRPVNV